MRQQTQIHLARRVLDFIEHRGTELTDKVFLNPVGTYTSEEQLALEREVFFGQSPLLHCLSSQIPQPGDYVADELSGTPILVVRGQDGVARAMLNMCRHRGAQLKQGHGHCERAITCPYHAWTYSFEGKLRVVTPNAGFPGIGPEERSLIMLPCVERHGFVWVLPQPEGQIDEAALFGGMDDEIASYGFAGYKHHDTRRVTKAMNWKLVIDTFMETWHVGTLHRETVAPIFQPAVNVFDAFGLNGRLIIPRRSIIELKDKPETEWDFLPRTAVVYTALPNSLIVWQGDHLEVWRAFPGRHAGECIAEASLFIPRAPENEREKRYWDKNMDLLLRTVEEEDFPVCEGIQRSCAREGQTHLTFGRNEPALIHFHRQIRSRLGLADN